MSELSPRRVPNTNLFEVVMFNTEVREMIENEQHHPRWDDGWADNRYIELPALNVRSVIKKIRSRFPRGRGFKILAVTEISDYSYDKDKLWDFNI